MEADEDVTTPTITAEVIEHKLEENKLLIQAILENQNLGKLQECVQYQAILHQNLLLLASALDTHPSPVTRAAKRQKLEPSLTPTLLFAPRTSSHNPLQSNATPIPTSPADTSKTVNTTIHMGNTDQPRVSYWSRDEHQRFMEGLRLYGPKDLKKIAEHVKTRTHVQVRTHLTKYWQKLQKRQKQQQEQEQQESISSSSQQTQHDSQSKQKQPHTNDTKHSMTAIINQALANGTDHINTLSNSGTGTTINNVSKNNSGKNNNNATTAVMGLMLTRSTQLQPPARPLIHNITGTGTSGTSNITSGHPGDNKARGVQDNVFPASMSNVALPSMGLDLGFETTKRQEINK